LPATCLYANFVASLDGVVAGGGITSGTISLGSEADRFVMGLLRAVAGAVLIGAGTLRPDPGHRWTAEKIYPQAAAEFSELRASLGLPPKPPLAVVTATGRLPALTALTPGSLVITTRAGARAVAGSLPDTAELVVPSDGAHIPPADIVGVLRERGHARLLTEGGPQLFGELLAAGLVDELFLTTSPALFGGAPPAIGITGRLAPRTEPTEPTEPWARAQLLSLRRHGSHLFGRYGLGRSPSPDPPLWRPER
jgi:riboflavin biosynthesis pyrimidine reductase